MKFNFKMVSSLLLIMTSAMAFAQTTATISGSVSDNNGDTLPGVVVNAVHTPTGTQYNTVTRADGRYDLRNIRVGGPYTVSANMTGFQSKTQNNIFVKLGENKKVTFTLAPDSVSEELVVVAESNPIINPSRTGAVANITVETLEKLPSINRSLQDMARTNSYFMPDPSNGSLAVAGRNNRYNSIQIDGSANTDQFGLAASNTPGGQTESQPISLDAIQELELVISPYDVRYGGFTGGGINAITRSGTNALDGSVYYYQRDNDMVGDGPGGDEFGEFENTQLGARIGGPIIKDKLFYFASVEQNRQDQPADWSITQEEEDHETGEFGHLAEAQRFTQILRDVYGYDPIGFGEFIRKTDSDNFFIRFDYNINSNHQLIARHNFVDSNNHSRERGNRDFEFADGFYQIENETNSTVFQLNSTFGGMVNEARLNYTTIKDRRGANNDQLFPYVEVRISNGRDLRAGVERFSHANQLDQDLLEFNNELTFFRGNHTVTLGFNYQQQEFTNVFIQDWLGNYRFDSLDAFEAGAADRYQHSYSLSNDPLAASVVDVTQLGFYAGDEISVNENFNLILGIRAEVPNFSDDPTRNPLTEERFGKATNVSPDGNWLVSPRVGFNWDIKGDGTSQLRGGTGIFSGRPVFVWLSNNYSNTGLEFARIDAFFPGNNGEYDPDTATDVFVTDPLNQPREGLPTTDLTSTEFNLVDPDFKYPQVWRTSIGFDQELPVWGMVATGEFIYTDNQEEMLYRNLNLQAVENPDTIDNRVTMEAIHSDLGNAYYLTNTDKGYSWNGTFKLERTNRDGLGWSVSYTTGESKTLLDATSSRAVSNYRNLETTGDSNSNIMGRSDFDVKHRYTASMTYTANWMESAPTTFSLYYSIRSGRPYSNTYFGDANNDDNRFNDLIYVPNDESEVSFAWGNWEEFNAWIESDPGLRNYRGQILPRNTSREPWNSRLDLRIAQDLKLGKTKGQISLDIQNFGNMLDDESGHYRRVRFNNASTVSFRGYEDDGRMIIGFDPNRDDDGNVIVTETLTTLSRWYAKLGLRLSF